LIFSKFAVAIAAFANCHEAAEAALHINGKQKKTGSISEVFSTYTHQCGFFLVVL